jgi:flagellar biosynthesis/type III secretory pathway protein FliH
MSIEKNVNADVQNEKATDHIDAEQTTLTEQTLIQCMWTLIFGREVSDCDNSEDEYDSDDCECDESDFDDGYKEGYGDGYDDGCDEGYEGGYKNGHDEGYEEAEVAGLELAIKELGKLLYEKDEDGELLYETDEDDLKDVSTLFSRLEELLATWEEKYEEKEGWLSMRKDNEEHYRKANEKHN